MMNWYQDWITSKEFGDLLRGETYPIIELMNGEDKMKSTKWKYDGIGNYVIRDDETDKVLEISYGGYTLKRGAGKKKLRAENEYLKEQVAVLHSALLRIMETRKPTRAYSDGVNEIYDWTRTALDEYSTNEFNRRCELEGIE